MSDWQVFQQDVLDVMRQYKGNFDFFERVGSLSDNSRPDCFARVTRENKKEVWVVDAKNKASVDREDRKRMEKYLSMAKSNPIDIELDEAEVQEHEFRGIFVTNETEGVIKDYEQVKFSELHQFLQKELIYTDTSKLVRKIGKMMERRQLSHSQARMLFQSIKPYEQRLEAGMDTLREIESEFVGMELDKAPITLEEFEVSVDACLRHKDREKVFLFDIPYSRKALDKIEAKVDQIKGSLEGSNKEVYYTVIDTFDSENLKYVSSPESIREEIQNEVSAVSPDQMAKLFTPKVPVEKNYGENFIEIKDTAGLGYRARIQTKDDIRHIVEVDLPKKAAVELKNTILNSREDFGEIKGTRFQQRIEVKGGMKVSYGDTTEPWSSYMEAVRSIYQSSVNPILGKKVSPKV